MDGRCPTDFGNHSAAGGSRVKEGERPSSVIESYGLCRTTIYKWLRAARRGGEAALKARKHPGRTPILTARQKLQVRGWINGKDPRQYGFDFGLWTRQIVAALIEQKFGVRIGVTAVGRLLAELDITPQNRCGGRTNAIRGDQTMEDGGFPAAARSGQAGGSEDLLLR